MNDRGLRQDIIGRLDNDIISFDTVLYSLKPVTIYRKRFLVQEVDVDRKKECVTLFKTYIYNLS